MAKIGGRSAWLAWPVGVVCLGIVVVLVVMAAPLVPASVFWVGDTLRTGSGNVATGPATAADGDEPLGTDGAGAGDADGDAADDGGCRQLYPDVLWSELTARTGAPVQNDSPPATTAASLAAALAPSVERTCVWTATTTGEIVTTVASVPEEASAIAEASLQTQGFTCEEIEQGTYCSRRDGEVAEEHVFNGDIWLASQLTAWHPQNYSQRVAAQLWQ